MMFYVPFYNLLEVTKYYFFYSTKIIYKVIFQIDITYWNKIYYDLMTDTLLLNI